MADTAGLDPHIEEFIRAVYSKGPEGDTGPRELKSWLEVVVRDYGGLADRYLGREGTARLREQVSRGAVAGAAAGTLDRDGAAGLAHAEAGAGQPAKLGHLVAALLKRCGVVEAPASPSPAQTSTRGPATEVGSLPADGGAAAHPAADPAPTKTEPTAAAKAAAPAKTKPTPTIDQLGRDLTSEARSGKLPPIVGRDTEVEILVETLCRETKRNPLLIGPPGSGKTAIVEAFAARVAAGQVPALFSGVRVLAVETSTIVGGTQYAGALEERMQKIIKEASQPGVVLFIDEVHTIMSGRGSSVIADSLKPALARGEIAVIAATTDEEYRTHIKPDGALERRFQPIMVLEMDSARTLDVVKVRRDALSTKRGVQVDDEVLAHLVDFAGEHMHNRFFPDKAFDLLEQCLAFVVSRGTDRVTREVADVVLARHAGVIVSPAAALEKTPEALSSCGVSRDEDRQPIISRLRTTLNRLDVRPWRPNLVLGLVGEAAGGSHRLAAALAEALFGGRDRIVALDLSQIVDDEAITMLIGSPPGFVGFNRPLVIHELALMPRCVVEVTGADTCHPAATQIVAKGIRQGFIADSTGDRYYLSDAVVLVAASSGAVESRRRGLGFDPTGCGQGTDETERPDPAELFGHALADQFDFVLSSPLSVGGVGIEAWIRKEFIPEVAERYRKRGVELAVDDGAIAALASRCDGSANNLEKERIAEEWITRIVVDHLRSFSADAKRRVLVTTRDGLPVAVDQG